MLPLGDTSTYVDLSTYKRQRGLLKPDAPPQRPTIFDYCQKKF